MWEQPFRVAVSQIDLHTHTTASDGTLDPARLVVTAARAGLRAIAITDHDSTEGIDAALAAARAFPELEVIPGVELGTEFPGAELHMLGFYLDYQDSEFQETLRAMRESRHERARRTVERLGELGMTVPLDRIEELAAGTVGRPHIARVLVERGYVRTPQEAFDRYLGYGRPAYMPRFRLSPVDAVRALRRVGAVTVLAHPIELLDRLEDLLKELVPAGLAGIEVYYRDYGGEIVGRLRSAAMRHGLLLTGGTDFHGGQLLADIPIGGRDVPLECLERLRSTARRLRDVRH